MTRQPGRSRPVRTGLSIVLLLALAACSGLPAAERPVSPCSLDESSYDCQIQRYHDVSVG